MEEKWVNIYNDLYAVSNLGNVKANESRHQKIGDAEGHNIYVFDKNNIFIEELPSIVKAAEKYNISNTTMWRRAHDEKLVNNHYFKLHL